MSIVFVTQGALHFALGVTLFEDVAFVEILFTLGQGNFAFDQVLFPV